VVAARKAIIVTGSRDWTDSDTIWFVIQKASPHVVIHGDCPTGADKIAERAVQDLSLDKRVNIRSLPMAAQWEKHGRAAGPRRNREMLGVLTALGRTGYDIEVHAFPLKGSRGTRDMMNVATQAGVDVIDHGTD